MTFEEWWEDPQSNAYLLHGGTQSKAQARPTWHAAQDAIRERAAVAIQAWGVTEDDADHARLVEDVRALPVE